MYVLAARTWLPDLLVYFFICILAMVVALVIGCNLSYSMDMTENIAPIFIATYILVSTSLYPLLLHLFVVNAAPYGFAAFDIILTVVMLLLAMLHAQTIRGDRFIKMSTDDCLLAALLLFHEFLAIYAMTFFWQINYHFFTPKDFFWRSTSTSTASMSTTRKHHGGGPPVSGLFMTMDTITSMARLLLLDFDCFDSASFPLNQVSCELPIKNFIPIYTTSQMPFLWL
ncbi:uncharacterized protein [Drosophila kikkawai]